MENNCGFISCDKLDRVATWVGSNVASAFFASMERCSCINLSTTDNDEDEEAHDFPLILSRTTSHIGSQSEAENNDSGIWRLDMGVHAGIGLVPLEFSSLAQRKLQRRHISINMQRRIMYSLARFSFKTVPFEALTLHRLRTRRGRNPIVTRLFGFRERVLTILL
ncbi:hypothetical protein L6164_021248 [Bauhinia variegata]|uniref:Uncharacterized protein n=1 Tax=Bauhinia variegata TaxID=167791 RepID=A0ACB9MYF6_BAUVA|nr:hypothetical protein L6164_021248 [Bauhinia variegata]